MTPAEFKAWFDGFTEAFDKTPTKAQWARIKARVAEIDGKSVTEYHYVNHYMRYYPSYPGWQTWTTTLAGNVGASSNAYQSALGGNQNAFGFNSLSAMNALGQADALAVQG